MVHAAIPAPPGTVFHLDPLNPGAAVLSPDGSMIVFSARKDTGAYQLYLRSVNEGEAHALSGTDNGHYPFWSPDSKSIGFFTPNNVRRVDLASRTAITVCETGAARGGTWTHDGRIIFSPRFRTPLVIVDAGGGDSEWLTELDPPRSWRYDAIGKPLWSQATGVTELEDLGDDRTRVHFTETYHVFNPVTRALLERRVHRFISKDNDVLIKQAVEGGVAAMRKRARSQAGNE